MLLITAPSKTQNRIDRYLSFFTEPSFFSKSTSLIDQLKAYSVTDLCHLMKISRTLGESTHQRIADFRPPLTLENSRQALFTFQGDAYESLTPATYTEKQLRHAQRHLRILSGLYGSLRPLDLMFPYRLEMGCKITGKGWNNLYQFWGDTITDSINFDCKDHPDPTVINLASNEYSRVINMKKLLSRPVTITFQQKKGDGYATIPIHSKRARGLMIHYVIINGLTHAEQLQQFNLGEYSFHKELSTADNWFFRRK